MPQPETHKLETRELETHQAGTFVRLSDQAPLLAAASPNPQQIISYPFDPITERTFLGTLVKTILEAPELQDKPLTDILPNLTKVNTDIGYSSFDPIFTPEMSTRTHYALQEHLYAKNPDHGNNWAALAHSTAQHISSIRGIGKHSLDNILRILITLGLKIRPENTNINRNATDDYLTELLPHLTDILTWANTQHQATNLKTALQHAASDTAPEVIRAHYSALTALEADLLPAPKLSEACNAFLNRFNAHDRAIIVQRIINPAPDTIQALAEQLGVTPDNISHRERRLLFTGIGEVLVQPQHYPLVECAQGFESNLGPGIQPLLTESAISDYFGVTPSKEHMNLILWLGSAFSFHFLGLRV